MIVVVSDTSPIRALSNLGLIALLGEIYREVLVPPAVDRELRNPAKGQAAVDLSKLSFLQIQSPSESSPDGARIKGLDPGESEALALALEVHADLILIDEADARSMARELGLATIGVLFFLSDRLRDDVLRSAGEMP